MYGFELQAARDAIVASTCGFFMRHWRFGVWANSVMQKWITAFAFFGLGLLGLWYGTNNESDTIATFSVLVLFFAILWLILLLLSQGLDLPIANDRPWKGWHWGRLDLPAAQREDEIIPPDEKDQQFLRSSQDAEMNGAILPSGFIVPNAPAGFVWKVKGRCVQLTKLTTEEETK